MSRLARPVLAGALLLAAASLPAIAQPPAAADTTAAAAELRATLQAADAASRNSENGAVDSAPQKSDVSITAGKDKSTAKISLTGERAGGRLIGTLSTPVNAKDDATQFFTLDGPAEDVQLGLGWKRQWYDPDRISQLDLVELNERRLRLCADFGARPCSDTKLQEVMTAAGRSSAEIARTLASFSSVKLKGSERELSIFRAIPFHYFSIAGSLGRTERKFFDLPGAEQEEDRLSHSLGLTYGRIFEASRLSINLTGQRKFKEAEKARRCTVVAGSTLERCKDLPLGEAAVVDSVPLVFEYRFWRGRWAASPKLAYDFEQEVAAASLPIYLIADSDGRLTAGVRVDWEEHKDPVAFVFVSSALGLD